MLSHYKICTFNHFELAVVQVTTFMPTFKSLQERLYIIQALTQCLILY